MRDVNTPNIRERVWIEIIDHEQDPPKPVEEIFIENGVVRERRAIGREEGLEKGTTRRRLHPSALSEDLSRVVRLLEAMTPPAGTSADSQAGWDACRAEAMRTIAGWANAVAPVEEVSRGDSDR